MSIEKIAAKFGVAAVINAIAGAKVLGIGAAIHSESIGGYRDPKQINGYTYNPLFDSFFGAVCVHGFSPHIKF